MNKLKKERKWVERLTTYQKEGAVEDQTPPHGSFKTKFLKKEQGKKDTKLSQERTGKGQGERKQKFLKKEQGKKDTKQK